ncbi:transcription antitermination factor NusB, partial [Campylobacter concisus]|uniref:transcription antitermination factor NusB n=1 Tax=Campylobacter concisus TaxID=199 RepID=UPI000CD875B3
RFEEEVLEEKKIRNERKNEAQQAFKAVLANKEKLDEILKPHLKDGDFSKVGATELAILRLGLYEMKFSQTDKAVIINEAIELAKELGSDQAPKFINGVLDKIKGDL